MPRKKANPDRLSSAEEARGQTSAEKDDPPYQFKITLPEVEPAVWRRIQIRDCTLFDLHEYIQAAFGWENEHLHQFKVNGEYYSQPDPDGDDFGMDCKDETNVLLSQLLPKSNRRARWIYEYDFGDCWLHEVLFEGSVPTDPKATYPLCVEGERACPPEDCGGPWGYADFLSPLATQSTNGTRKFWNGLGHSTRTPSMRKRPRGR